MIETATTIRSLAQKIASTHLQKDDLDHLLDALVDHISAVENKFPNSGPNNGALVFDDGTIQKSGLLNRPPNINTIQRGVRDHVPIDDLVATFLAI